MVKLGDRVKDTVSGMTGIVMQIAETLHGCRRVQIERDKLNKDGSVQDGWWMDEPRVTVIKAGALKPSPTPAPLRTGGPPQRISNRT